MHLYEICEELAVPSCSCCLCNKVAMYVSDGKGFCSAHREQARQTQKQAIEQLFNVRETDRETR
jgi:hypothetical protein